MVNNIINVRYKMELETNYGTIIIEEEANVTGFVKVLFSKDAIVDIFSLRYPKNFCRVTYDSSKQDAFVWHMDKKQVNFQCNYLGLYIYKPDNIYLGAVKK